MVVINDEHVKLDLVNLAVDRIQRQAIFEAVKGVFECVVQSLAI